MSSTWSPSFVERCVQTKEQCKQRLQTEIDATIDTMFAFFMDELGLAVKDAVAHHVQSLQSSHTNETYQQHHLSRPETGKILCTKAKKKLDELKVRRNLTNHSQVMENIGEGKRTMMDYDSDRDCECSDCQEGDLFDDFLDVNNIKRELFEEDNDEIYLTQSSGMLNSDSSSSSINQQLNHLDLNFPFGNNLAEIKQEQVEMQTLSGQSKRQKTCSRNDATNQPDSNYINSSADIPLPHYGICTTQGSETSNTLPIQDTFGHYSYEDFQSDFKSNYQPDMEEQTQPHHQSEYNCKVHNCDKSFKMKCLLKQHQQTHLDIRPFPCAFVGCGKWFRNKNHLQEHQRIHRGVRPYRCKWEGCQFDATDRSTTINHIRGIHFNLPRSRKEQKERNIVDCRDPRDYIEVVANLL